MTNEQRHQIKFLCSQIEVVQDETVFLQVVCELQELINMWLYELHHPPKIRQSHMHLFPSESKVNGNDHQTGYNPNTDTKDYEQILDVAVGLMRSDYASLQMLYPERGSGGELRLLAFRGFDPHAAAFWEWVRADSNSTCGMALRNQRRVVAPNIATCDFMANSEDQKVYLQTGIHACQTTPLIARTGLIVGMISTHWSMPYQPSDNDFRTFDFLAKEAAELIQRKARKQAQLKSTLRESL
jgi:hypothetical protein